MWEANFSTKSVTVLGIIIQDDFSNIYLRLIYIVFAIYHFVYLITNQLDNKKIAIHTELETNPRYTDGA